MPFVWVLYIMVIYCWNWASTYLELLSFILTRLLLLFPVMLLLSVLTNCTCYFNSECRMIWPRHYFTKASLDTYRVPTVVYSYYTSKHFSSNLDVGGSGLRQWELLDCEDLRYALIVVVPWNPFYIFLLSILYPKCIVFWDISMYSVRAHDFVPPSSGSMLWFSPCCLVSLLFLHLC